MRLDVIRAYLEAQMKILKIHKKPRKKPVSGNILPHLWMAPVKWNSLASRRRASRLSTFCKVFNNKNCLRDLSEHITREPIDMLRHVHAFRVRSLHCRKNIGHYSFLPRTIRDWNSLPKSLMSQKSIENPSHFRSLLIDHQ